MTGLVSIGYLHTGDVKTLWANSREQAAFHDYFGAQRFVSHEHGYIGVGCASGDLVTGRNKIARRFLDDPGERDWLFMVDTDMGFDKTIVEALIAAADPEARPVVGALCFALRSSEQPGSRYRIIPTIYDLVQGEQVGFVPRLDYERDALVQCDGTGCAALLIHRNALTAIRERWGDVWFDQILHPLDPADKFSEDMSFCLRLTGCGIPLHVHTGIRTSHDKGVIVLDEAEFDAQRGRADGLADPG